MLKQLEKNVLQVLFKDNLLKKEQVSEIEELMKTNEKNLREVLVGGGYIEEEKLVKIESDIFSLPYINLLEEEVSLDILETVPYKLAKNQKVICFSKEDKRLKIALVEPEKIDVREVLSFWATKESYKISYYICSEAGWRQLLARYQTITEEVQSVLGRAKEKFQTEEDKEEVTNGKIDQIVKSAPVSKIVSTIIRHGVENKASDIHIEPRENETRVRYRIDGVLHNILVLPSYIQEAVVSRIKVLANLKLDETRVPQDGRIKIETAESKIDLRVSTMPLLGKEKVTLRILDTSGKVKTLSELGFSKNFIKLAEENITKPFGMFLITGPTGSGKSTTLYSLLNFLNKEGVNIATLEDPIEYYSPGVNQSQIRPEVGFTFASGLRSVLRQDPDIVMVGEIRDNETAEMAVHAALTGHLLFSTLHTNDSLGAIPRLVDMKVEPFLLASVLNAVVAQRLARRICPKCKIEEDLPKGKEEQVRNILLELPDKSLVKDFNLEEKLTVYKGKGCSKCKNSGYVGRIVLAEILPVTEKMRKIIGEGFKLEEVKKETKRVKMVSLLQDGLIKVLEGKTTVEEVFRVAAEVEEEF